MSRIAKNSIKISSDIECNYRDGVFSAKGKLGEMKLIINPNFQIDINEDQIMVKPKNTKDKKNPIWGTIS